MKTEERIDRNPKLENALERYRRHLQSRGLPEARVDRIAGHYAEAERTMQRMIQMSLEIADRNGRVRSRGRKALSQMARALYGVSRRAGRRTWAAEMACEVIARVQRGLDEEVALEAFTACWRILVPDCPDEEAKRLLELCRAKLRPPVPRPNDREACHPFGVDRISNELLQVDIGKETGFDLAKRRSAMDSLSQALMIMPPWTRRCVMGRLARRRSYAALAREFELPVEKLKELLDYVRSQVHRYTTFFDDDWYWCDCGSPGAAAGGEK